MGWKAAEDDLVGRHGDNEDDSNPWSDDLSLAEASGLFCVSMGIAAIMLPNTTLRN